MPNALKKRSSRRKGLNAQPVGSQEAARLEFFRQAMALMPDDSDPYPGIAYDVDSIQGSSAQRFCSCKQSGKTTCDHIKALSRIGHAFNHRFQPHAAEAFLHSPWLRMAAILADGCRETLETIQMMRPKEHGGLVVVGRSKEPLLVYLSTQKDALRLVERCRRTGSDDAIPTRAEVLRQLASMTLTHDEIVLRDKGLKTSRQVFEGKFWHRFAYHCFREFGLDGCLLHPAVDEKTGDFILNGKDPAGGVIFFVPVQRNKVKRLLKELKDALTNQHGLAIQPLCLDAIFDVRLTENLDLEIQPLLRLLQQNGEHRFFKRQDLKKYQYGDLYYIKDLGMLVEDRYPAPARLLTDAAHTVIQHSQVPQFLSEYSSALDQELFRVEDSVRQLKLMSTYDRTEISPEAIDQDWCWLSVSYGNGEQSISLAALLRAGQAGQRFVATPGGWVDCDAAPFRSIVDMVDQIGPDAICGETQHVRLSRADVFRLDMIGPTIREGSDHSATERLRHILEFKPLHPHPECRTMTCVLRGYQEKGLQWLWFLYENRFGGLLCDDMGLGKTHQVMAFLMGLRESEPKRDPFLVVCPTSVISHWERKLAEYAPGLSVAVYYGGNRGLPEPDQADVIITSYGILRRDFTVLAPMAFHVVVLDEIQNVKNAETQAYKAAYRLNARMKIGLTGTPIENRIGELKSLMDIAVPGYLGSDERFAERYRIPIENNTDPLRHKQLSRLISPFTLRRLKKSVLDELPEKIEDLRSCRLSQEQVRLYRDAIEGRGRELARTLARNDVPVPYLHIFALLTMLKQICDHPALVEKNLQGYDQYASGKWDVFTELLSACLDSGQKVVVYSQYLGMIEIISHYLNVQKVGFVSLTGGSRERGRIIERFDRDPNCRVFVGSLKAGGVGIDLVAASVVIHYDRWWNAAREDQATDRVHRIGQKRGVHVFKLITEGTLEEKIAAIISKKRHLMESIVKEDDPALVKTFTRQDLMDLMAMPGTFRETSA
jgi:superfamily II DNA or RNA helicase